MADNIKDTLCVQTVENSYRIYPELTGAIIQSVRGSQYASKEYRDNIQIFKLKHNINSSSSGCHNNAHCESMWARMKENDIDLSVDDGASKYHGYFRAVGSINPKTGTRVTFTDYHRKYTLQQLYDEFNEVKSKNTTKKKSKYSNKYN